MLILRTIARHTSLGLSYAHPITLCLSPLFISLPCASNVCPYISSSVGLSYLVCLPTPYIQEIPLK
jgi:hypothetical protein